MNIVSLISLNWNFKAGKVQIPKEN